MLTAAHCFQGRIPDLPRTVHVYLGRHYRQNRGKKYAVEEVFIHPKWKLPTGEIGAAPHDIALLKLSKDAELSSIVALDRLFILRFTCQIRILFERKLCDKTGNKKQKSLKLKLLRTIEKCI